MIIVTIVVTDIKAFFCMEIKIFFFCGGKPSLPAAVLRRERAAWFVHVHLIADVLRDALKIIVFFFLGIFP